MIARDSGAVEEGACRLTQRRAGLYNPLPQKRPRAAALRSRNDSLAGRRTLKRYQRKFDTTLTACPRPRNGRFAISKPLRAGTGIRLATLLAAFLLFLGSSAGPGQSGPEPPPPKPPEPQAEAPSVPALPSETPASPSEQPAESPPLARPEDEQIPVLSLPDPPTADALGRLALPPRPYSIYVGSARELTDAEATLREFRARGLPAYLSPVNVRGPVAQSLYGVSQDGLWYRILVGSYTSPESARKILKFIMEKLSTYQPEILKFPYALECARALDPSRAEETASALAARGLFPYVQTWRVESGGTLHRVLVGCHFSRAAAATLQRELEAKGLSCRCAER